MKDKFKFQSQEQNHNPNPPKQGKNAANLQKMIKTPEDLISVDKLFLTYMNLIGKCDGEEIYQLIASVGEGIMRHKHIAKGIELVYSELESYSPHYQAEKKESDSIEIMYIVEGHGEFELFNRQYVSGDKGDILIFNSQSSVKKCLLGKSGMNGISIFFFAKEAVEFLNDFFKTSDFTLTNFFKDVRNSDSVLSFPAGNLLETLFMQMIKISDDFSEYKVRLSVIQVLLLLMNKKDNRDSSDLYFSGITGRKVQNARRIINSNLEKEISIDELSKKVNLNRTTLQKVFKEMYGLTVNDYRTKSRMQLAKNLLVSTELSITEIAGRCGYANASKFSETFKKTEGVLPKAWRK